MSSMVVGIAFDKHGKVIANDCGQRRLSSCKTYGAEKPLLSRSMGCHQKQIALLNATIKRHGVPGVRYVQGKHGGVCEITSRRGRAQWGKIFGEMHGLGPLHDHDGGYGDE
jgi:hypothetical protein